MPTPQQLALGAAAAVGAYYLFARHQQQKNALDKASDSWEKTKTDISRSMPGQENLPLSDRAYDAAKSTYLDAKESARRSSASGGGGP